MGDHLASRPDSLPENPVLMTLTSRLLRGARPFSGGRLPMLGCLALLLVAAGCGPPAADLVLTNAGVYSLAWPDPSLDGMPHADAPFDSESGWHPDAEAVVVDDGVVVLVGSAAEAEDYVGADTQVLDLTGSFVIPGLVETHTHVAELGTKLAVLDLTGVPDPQAAVDLAANWAAELPEGAWVIGHGWDEGAWASAYPTWDVLNERIPNHPVLLRGLHGFAAWGNRPAFEAAGIDGTTSNPVGGEILRDAAGKPTGVVLNRAVPLLERGVPETSAEERQSRILVGLEEMAASGFVGVHEAGVPGETLAALQELNRAGRLPLRFYAMLSARDATLMDEWIARGVMDTMDDMLRVRAVKAYYDGSLGSRGARLLADYADQPGHRGVSGDGYGFDQARVERAMQAGFQVGIHAIGDAGNREALDFIARVNAESEASAQARHRIEHAQVVHPADLPRFAEMGVIASMQPPHAVEDMPWAEARVGPARVQGAYAWRTLRRGGTHLVFSADLPGSDHSIFYGLHSAVTRTDKSGSPPGGWYPDEALTVEESLRAYTTWAAYAGFAEERSGRIAPGTWADFTVMDIDPLQTGRNNPSALLDGRILMTIVGGQVVFQEGSSGR